jgi:hypothetical protein
VLDSGNLDRSTPDDRIRGSRTVKTKPIALLTGTASSKKRKRRSKSISKALQRPLVSEESAAENVPLSTTIQIALPVVVGNTYLKFENIDLEDLMVASPFFLRFLYKRNLCFICQAPKSKRFDEYVPLHSVCISTDSGLNGPHQIMLL